jgi:phage gp37-like protein
MLADLENELIAAIKASPLGRKVRSVDSLPKLDGKALVSRFLTDVPAVYVAPGAFGATPEGLLLPRFGIAVLAKNAAGQVAARQGDSKTIGVYDMIDALISVLWNFSGSCAWHFRSAAMIDDDVLFQNGLWGALLQIDGTAVEPPAPIDEAALDAFLTFHDDIDIAPLQIPAVQAEWSQANYIHGQPDAQDQITLP